MKAQLISKVITKEIMASVSDEQLEFMFLKNQDPDIESVLYKSSQNARIFQEDSQSQLMNRLE